MRFFRFGFGPRYFSGIQQSGVPEENSNIIINHTTTHNTYITAFKIIITTLAKNN